MLSADTAESPQAIESHFHVVAGGEVRASREGTQPVPKQRHANAAGRLVLVCLSVHPKHRLLHTLDHLVILAGELAQQLCLPDMVGLVEIQEEHQLAECGRIPMPTA